MTMLPTRRRTLPADRIRAIAKALQRPVRQPIVPSQSQQNAALKLAQSVMARRRATQRGTYLGG